jgi:hypothetical protein
MSIYSESSIKKIRSIASPPSIHRSIFSEIEIEELIEIERSSVSDIMVDRVDSRKTEVNWSTRAKDIVLPKLEEAFGYKIVIGDFPAHFITNKYPLRVHVDMGKDPKVIPHRNILIPLSITGNFPTHTILFKKKWYDIASLFTSNERSRGGSNDYTFKDLNGKFIYISDSMDFLINLEKNKNKILEYSEGAFKSSPKMISEVKALLGQKRYQQRTCDHIINTNPFDIELYQKYLTHQPYEDLTSLEVEHIIEWHPGDIISFDRTTLHCASNFLEQGVSEKMAMVMFTVWEENE